jgi:hypothetical protein
MRIFKRLFGVKDQSSEKKLDLEKLLASTDINCSIIELDDYVCQLCAHGDNLGKLTDAQKQFFYNESLERQVNNGGFSQYFFNSSGNFAHQTVQSLRKINACATADILQMAIHQFPNRRAPENREERQAMMVDIQAQAERVWDELDQKFFAYEDDLNTLNMKFIQQNKDQF